MGFNTAFKGLMLSPHPKAFHVLSFLQVSPPKLYEFIFPTGTVACQSHLTVPYITTRIIFGRK